MSGLAQTRTGAMRPGTADPGRMRLGDGANPFSDSSKSFHFYPSPSHRKGVHRITRGLRSGCGLILLIGEIGIGKTTLARHIQSTCRREYAFAELANPYLTPNEQLHFLCSRFRVGTDGLASTDDYVQALNRCFVRLVEQGRPPVVVLDESHLLDRAHFGLLLILSNLRHKGRPLVQILLVGQVELLKRLAEPGLEAMNQRIGVRCELAPLSREDTGRYIEFKLRKAGHEGRSPFTDRAVRRIWDISGGLPRLINHACSHALDHAGFSRKSRITPDCIERVYRDPLYSGLFRIRTRPDRTGRRRMFMLAAAGVVLLVGVAVFLVVHQGLLFQERTNAVARNAVRMVPAPVPVAEDAAARPSAEPGLGGQDSVTLSEPVEVVEPGLSSGSQSVRTDIGSRMDEPADFDGDSDGITGNGLFAEPAPDSPVAALSVDAVAWDENPDKRMAIINGTILHAGDSILGIRLQAIEPDGLVLEHGGILYERRMPANEGQ